MIRRVRARRLDWEHHTVTYHIPTMLSIIRQQAQCDVDHLIWDSGIIFQLQLAYHLLQWAL